MGMSFKEALMELGLDTYSEEKAIITIREAFADQAFLQCLEGAGVDNWDGYSEAREMYESEKLW